MLAARIGGGPVVGVSAETGPVAGLVGGTAAGAEDEGGERVLAAATIASSAGCGDPKVFCYIAHTGASIR